MTKYAELLVFLLLVAGAAYFGMTYEPGPFYAALQKPAWTPPDTVFAPVWTVLYVMIAIAGWIVWRAHGFGPLLWLWLLQLGLNAAWSYLMFGEKQITSALIDIGALVARHPRLYRCRLAGAPLRGAAVRAVFPVGDFRGGAQFRDLAPQQLSQVALSAPALPLLELSAAARGAHDTCTARRRPLRGVCADCGAPASGNFCSSCGADLREGALGFLGQAVAPVRRSFPVVYLKLLRSPIRQTVALRRGPELPRARLVRAGRHRHLSPCSSCRS